MKGAVKLLATSRPDHAGHVATGLGTVARLLELVVWNSDQATVIDVWRMIYTWPELDRFGSNLHGSAVRGTEKRSLSLNRDLVFDPCSFLFFLRPPLARGTDRLSADPFHCCPSVVLHRHTFFLVWLLGLV